MTSRILLLGLLLVAVPALAQTPDDALDATLADVLSRSRLGQAETLVQGTVADATTGEPVIGAFVVLVRGASRFPIETDAEGSFRLAGLAEGRYDLTVRHLAFPTVTDSIVVVGGGRATRVHVQLHPQVVELSPIVVTADARPTFGVLAPVYDRLEFQRSLGFGRFFDRSEIEAAGAFNVDDMLTRLPGVSVVGRQITLNAMNPGCARRSPVVYLDGVKFNLAGDALSTLVPLSQIEVLEVYRRPAEIPGEFSGSDAQCGVIAVWTRRGG